MDITGLVAVTLLFGGGTLFLLAISPVGKAIAARILGKQSAVIDEDELLKEVKELRDEVDALSAGGDPAELAALRQSVDELAERVDFAERLLAKQRDSAKLGGGAA
jgi:hypothetical protein